MKIVFFGPTLSRSHADHRARVLSTLLEGVADRGHHIVYVAPEAKEEAAYPFLRFVTYEAWAGAREAVEAECRDASAVVVASGFAEGPAAVEWILDLQVPARAFYDLDPWQTLEAFDRTGAADWIRADQIPAFSIVLSLAGGPALEAYRATWGANEVIALYEAVDPAIWHPRSPDDELACDVVLVADHDAAAEATFDTFLVETARALPNHRFLVAGSGWKGAASWPANVELVPAGGAVTRATLYSSARLVLVPIGPDAIEYAMPVELLEPAACAAACVVVDRPGLADLFAPGEEILVPESAEDLIPYLTTVGDARIVRLGHLAEKRVVRDHVALRAATKFEQRLARMFYRGHNG